MPLFFVDKLCLLEITSSIGNGESGIEIFCLAFLQMGIQ